MVREVDESKIRDLSRLLYDLAISHVSYSQVADIVNNATDHMAARARIEELNRSDGIPLAVLETSYRITRRSLLNVTYKMARTFPNFHYATLGTNEVRIVTTDLKHFKVSVTEE